ncbi:NAD(+)/NADH kinase [Chloroflexota bacterium]
MVVKKVGILYHPMIETAHTLADEIKETLTSSGVSVWLCPAPEGGKARALMNGTDLILTTGGDGTILRAAHVALKTGIPITGINLGKLGFMTELSVAEYHSKLPALIAGSGWIDERAMLEVELSPPGGDEKEKQTFFALNDVVVARGVVARIVHLETSIDGVPLTTYKADGIIMATATGSTGYALSAGGPILHPQADDFLLLPILPHLSSSYSLVLPEATEVKLRTSTPYQATLNIDGHINLSISDSATVTVRHSQQRTRFLRIHPQKSFYGSLEKKLKGKQIK